MAAPAPLDKQFNDSYAIRGTTSSNPNWNIQAANENAKKLQAANDNKSHNGVRNVKVAKRATGTAMQATGVSMQFAGKGMKSVGKTTTKAGTRLTATGLGAIVGVPLIAIGGATTGVGVGTDIAGKQVSRYGKKMSRKGSASKIKGITGGAKGISVHVRAFWIGSFFAPIIMILAFFELGSFLLALAVDAVTNTEAKNTDGVLETIWKFGVTVVKGAFDGASAVINAATGGLIDLDAIVGAVYPGNYFILFYLAIVGFSIMTLMSVWAVYEFSGSQPLSGNGAGQKKAAFLLTICLYCVPIVHIFPWFLIWSFAILKNGK